MAEIGNSNPTLLDVASRLEDKKVAAIVEILNETNEILEDVTFIEANDGTSHKSTIRSGLPAATWRKLNYGVQPTKSTTVQVKDSTGMLEAYAEIDKSLADLNGNTNEFRLSEDKAHLEGMGQGFAETLFYGDTTTSPEKFMGMTPRYNDLSAENADNIIVGDGAGSDNTSIWLMVWSPNTMHCIYPKGSMAGIHHKDLGEVTLEDADGGKFQGYRSHYKLDNGLSVRDWRYAVRICNIDVSNLKKDAASGSDLIDLMTQAIELLPNESVGRARFYCNKTIRSFLRRQIRNANNVNISMEQVSGKKVVAFDEIPVRRCDAILSTEALVS